MQKTNLEMIDAIEWALYDVGYDMDRHDTMDFIEELSKRGYSIVKDEK